MTLISMLFAASAAVAAQTGAPAAGHQNSWNANVAATDKPKAEQLTCRRLQVTGSRMWERVCLTKKQWEEVEKQARG